jgi:hypothetical protein
MKNLSILLFLFFFYLIEVRASSTEVLVTERGQILISKIKDWEMGKDMFGMPYIYFSPQANGQRSNISFTATGVETDVDLTTLGKNQDTYKKMKQQWSETVNAKVLGFIPYKRWKNKEGHIVHQIGFEYLHEELPYVENSFYVDCRGKLIYSKSLRLKVNNRHQTHFEKLISDMDCGL